jgi:hypothetical protein
MPEGVGFMSARLACFVLTLLLLFAEVSSVRSLPELWRGNWSHPHYVDSVTRYEQRFARVKDELPPHGLVGYETYRPLKRDEVDEEEWKRIVEEHFLAQYALAPTVVHFSPNHAIVVRNLPEGVLVCRGADE